MPAADLIKWLEEQLKVVDRIHKTGLLSIDQKVAETQAKIMLRFDVEARNVRHESLIIAVVRYVDSDEKQVHYLKYLYHLGCDPNDVDKQGRNALMFAAMERKLAAVNVLIKRCKVDMRVHDRNGNSALMYAASYGADEILMLMINRLIKTWGIEAFRERNSMGNSALDLAEQKGHDKCAQLLQNNRLLLLDNMHMQMNQIEARIEPFRQQSSWAIMVPKAASIKWHRTVDKRRRQRDYSTNLDAFEGRLQTALSPGLKSQVDRNDPSISFAARKRIPSAPGPF